MNNLYFLVSTLPYCYFLYKKYFNTKYFKKFFVVKSLVGDENIIKLTDYLPSPKKEAMYMLNVYNDHSTIKASFLLDTTFDTIQCQMLSCTDNVKNHLKVNEFFQLKLESEYNKLEEITDDEVEFEGFYISIKEL